MSPLPTTTATTVAQLLSERWGIAVGLFPADATSDLEIQRAPDSAGSPNVGAALTIGQVSPGTQVFVDERPQDGARWHYRIRATGVLGTVSAWTGWVNAIAAVLPPVVARPAPVLPIVTLSRSSTATAGTLTATITDPQSRLTLVEFRTKIGTAAYSSWGTDGAVPYETTVTLQPGDVSRIGFRVTAYDEAGVLRIIAEGEEEFDVLNFAMTLSVSASFDEDGALKVRVIGDINTKSIRVAVSTSAFPSSGTVGGATAVDGRQSEWSFAGPYALGQAVYVSALAYAAVSGGGTASDKIDTLIYRANSATSKTIRLPSSSLLLPAVDSDSSMVDRSVSGYLQTTGFFTLGATIPVPKGATLTAVRMRAWVANAGGSFNDYARIRFYRVDQDGAKTQLGSDAVTTTFSTWETITISSLSEDTSGDRSYFLWLAFLIDGGAVDNRSAWIEYDIDVPSVDVST